MSKSAAHTLPRSFFRIAWTSNCSKHVSPDWICICHFEMEIIPFQKTEILLGREGGVICCHDEAEQKGGVRYHIHFWVNVATMQRKTIQINHKHADRAHWATRTCG